MTKREKAALNRVAREIRYLSSLESARFSINDEVDETIKIIISHYMIWFTSCAEMLEDMANATNKYEKEDALDFIEHYYNK